MHSNFYKATLGTAIAGGCLGAYYGIKQAKIQNKIYYYTFSESIVPNLLTISLYTSVGFLYGAIWYFTIPTTLLIANY